MMFKTPEGAAEYAAAYNTVLARWPVPYETFRVPTTFGDTHVIACGPKAGPPLVLLHGAGTSSTLWRPNVPAVSRTYRTYLVDIVGDPNLSDCSRRRNTRAESVQWLTEVLDGLGVDRIHLGGLSLGGWLTINFALAVPERVKSIILLAPAATFFKFPLSFFYHFLVPILFPSRARLDGVFRWMSASGEVVDELLAEQMYQAVKHFRFQNSGTFPDVYTDAELQSLQVPTLLLIGEREVIYDAKRAWERAARLIPNLQGQIVPGASHLLNIEQAEVVDRRMTEFLARLS